MDLIDTQFIGLVSTKLQKFSKKKNTLYTFRCPFCGDSQRNKNKTRGYLYQVKNNTNFKCHNCGLSMSFNNFLKELDPQLHKRYSLEKFKSGFTGKNYTTSAPEFDFDKPDFSNRKQPQKINLPKASENVTAKKYLEGRKLPSEKFYFAEKFKEFSNSLTDTFDSLNGDHPRIVIPFYDANNYLIGFQGRSIDQRDKPKYLTVMVDKNAPKIYGLNEVDLDLPVYITEGPFDSLFLKNSIAMAGADIDLQFIKKRHNTKFIFVLDNEPRNKEIVDRYDKLISMDQNVVIWPSHITDKDLNDMVLSGHNVQSMVESNTYSKLEAQLKFSQWKKI
jgi:hypothetical protein